MSPDLDIDKNENTAPDLEKWSRSATHMLLMRWKMILNATSIPWDFKAKNINRRRTTNGLNRLPLLRLFSSGRSHNLYVWALRALIYILYVLCRYQGIYSMKSRRKRWRINRFCFSAYWYTEYLRALKCKKNNAL